MARVFRDWGGEDYLDLMAAVDRVTSRPYVDSARLGVHGYSYGGYMAAWIVGQTDRFKAAIVAAPVTNLVSIYGQMDIAMTFGEAQWGGPPWEDAAEYALRSPLTYAERVSTPVLLLHGEADLRCPISQSEEYYVALKRLGKAVEFVRFPGGYHSFPNTGHPALREAYYARVLEWFDRHLGTR
jgi:dipeptidyl aminopeptidase/acylaminoacyl peptidase